MENQPDINVRMRGILVDWLIEVSTESTLVWFLGNSLVTKPLLCAGALQFELMEETLYLTINLIDRFLAVTQHVPRKKLQLVGVTALLFA